MMSKNASTNMTYGRCCYNGEDLACVVVVWSNANANVAEMNVCLLRLRERWTQKTQKEKERDTRLSKQSANDYRPILLQNYLSVNPTSSKFEVQN